MAGGAPGSGGLLVTTGGVSSGGLGSGGIGLGGTPPGSGGNAPIAQCPVGSFSLPDTAPDKCIPWTDCMQGTFIATTPSSTTDRTCAPCEMGTYSFRENSEFCEGWSLCGFDEVVLEPATHSNDYVCERSERAPWFSAGSNVDILDMAISSSAIYLVGTSSPEPSLGLVAEFDTTGQLIAERFIPLDFSVATGVVVDAADVPTVVGTAPAPIDPSAFVGRGPDPGVPDWAIQYPHFEFSSALGVALGIDGSTWVVGHVTDATTQLDSLIQRYNPNGALHWSLSVDLGGNDLAYAVAVDSKGNGYVTGAGTLGGYLIKYDADGNELWRILGAGRPCYSCQKIAIDTFDRVTIGGSTIDSAMDPSFIVRQYDEGGNEIWARQLPTYLNLVDLTLNGDGEVYLAGFTTRKIYPVEGAFVAKLSTTGELLWIQEYGEFHMQRTTSVALDQQGRIWLAGLALDNTSQHSFLIQVPDLSLSAAPKRNR